MDFIDQYDQIFYPEEPFFSKSGQRAVFSLAIKAITGKQFNDLKTLLDHYNILQLKDSNYNNLLHGAVITDNYPVARLLLMRGIDMKAINNMGYSAMDLAKGLNNSDMIFLLNSAGFYK